MYTIETKLASKKGWHTPAEARAYYGKYARNGITVHWWNSPSAVKDSDHDNIVNYIRGKASAGTGSVNYVLSNKKITLLVQPENVAWASQAGNPTTISVEFSPHLNAEGYKKAGWLIYQLEKRFGKKLALYKHSQWFKTACPGTLDLNRMRREADKWRAGGYNPKPVPKPTVPKLKWSKLSKPTVYVTNKPTTKLWDFNSTSWDMKEVKSYKKGHKVTVYGKCVNETLNATYLLTEYSYTKKITNGFNQVDMDLYVAPPKPTPKPPVPPEPKPEPIDPKPEVPVDTNAIIAFLTMLKDLITGFLEKLKGG